MEIMGANIGLDWQTAFISIDINKYYHEWSDFIFML